jgi:hypothetical protein
MKSVLPVLVSLLFLAAPSLGHAAACAGDSGHPKAPFLDANCDGCFDTADGDDADVTQAELEQQPFQIPNCLVVPKGAHVVASEIYWRGGDQTGHITILGDVAIVHNGQNGTLRLQTSGAITVGGKLRGKLPHTESATTGQANILLQARTGITVLPGASFIANGSIDLEASGQGELTVAPGIKFKATKGGVSLTSEARDILGPVAPPVGRVTVGAGVKIAAKRSVSLQSARELTVGAKLTIKSDEQADDAPSIQLRSGLPMSLLDPTLGGDMSIGPKMLLRSLSQKMLFEANGALGVGTGGKLVAKGGPLAFLADGTLTVDGMKGAGFGMEATSATGDVTLSGRFKSTSAGAATTIEAPGTCDVSGLDYGGIVTFDCGTVVP